MKTLRTARKNVSSQNIQLKKADGTANLSSPAKSDLGTSISLKITFDPAPQPTPPPSSSIKLTSHSLPSNPEQNPKKCKTSDLGGIYEQGFDAIAWSEKHILPHNFISMDDILIKSHLQHMARGGVQTTGICTTLLRELEKTPFGSIQHTLFDLQAKVSSLRESKKEYEEDKESLLSDFCKVRAKTK
ncbi:hypothetical protein AHAS_Ahas19G0228400 [Arachis hypogaea]